MSRRHREDRRRRRDDGTEDSRPAGTPAVGSASDRSGPPPNPDGVPTPASGTDPRRSSPHQRAPDMSTGAAGSVAAVEAGRAPDRAEGREILEIHAAVLREMAEPRDGFQPLPVWLASIFGALAFWCGWYFSNFSGDLRADILDEDPAVLRAGGEPEPLTPVQLGKRLFTGYCAACHQPSGAGVPGQYPPLARSEWVTGDEGRLKRILLHGLSGPVKVKGRTYNGQMPPWGGKLDDTQIAAVLTFLRQEWGNSAPAVDVESVARTRAETKARSSPWTEADLLALPPERPAAGTSAPTAPTPPAATPKAGTNASK